MKCQPSVSSPARTLLERNDVIRFSVTSGGMTGPEWIEYLGEKRVFVKDRARRILCSPVFESTNGITTEIGVLKGCFFSDNERFARNIRVSAEGLGFIRSNVELACLISDKLSGEVIGEKMGLGRIVVMHEPIKEPDGHQYLLTMIEHSEGHWLDVCRDGDWPYPGFGDCVGFAFVDSLVEH